MQECTDNLGLASLHSMTKDVAQMETADSEEAERPVKAMVKVKIIHTDHWMFFV